MGYDESETRAEKAVWKDYALRVSHALGVCYEADYVHEPGPLDKVLKRISTLTGAERLEHLDRERDMRELARIILRAFGWINVLPSDEEHCQQAARDILAYLYDTQAHEAPIKRGPGPAPERKG